MDTLHKGENNNDNDDDDDNNNNNKRRNLMVKNYVISIAVQTSKPDGSV
jgi:hypothetical protein